MNRAARRQMEKAYRHSGMSKQVAKQVVTANFTGEKFQSDSKCRLNYELIIRNPQFNLQEDEFKQWIIDHKDMILTVDQTRYDGLEVTFKEDTREQQFWHKSVTLLPVASAKIKLDNGEEKTVVLDGVSDMNDPRIMEEVNKELNKEEE